MICKQHLYKYRKKCGYFIYLLSKHKIFLLSGQCLQRLMENLCTTHLDSDSFDGQGHYGIKRHFQDLPAGRTLWCIYRSVIGYQNNCFIVQKFYSLF